MKIMKCHYDDGQIDNVGGCAAIVVRRNYSLFFFLVEENHLKKMRKNNELPKRIRTMQAHTTFQVQSKICNYFLFKEQKEHSRLYHTAMHRQEKEQIQKKRTTK